MRLLRASIHLMLALAILALGWAPIVSRMPARAPVVAVESADHEHVQMASADHAHSRPAEHHASHQPDTCQSACCFLPPDLPVRPDRVTVQSFCAVTYRLTSPRPEGRSSAPDPGIPKLVA